MYRCLRNAQPHFSPNNMIEAHLPFLTPGAHVSALATCFDNPRGRKWSRLRYGEQWDTARVRGVVLHVDGDVAMVRWEDDTEIPLHIDNLELAGDTLRSAPETAIGKDNS